MNYSVLFRQGQVRTLRAAGNVMQTVLVAGASRGIGFELARQFAADGWQVIATCRDARAAARLAKLPGDVRVETLDIADNDSCIALRQRLAGVGIDLLLLNAGVNPQHGATLRETDYDLWRGMFQANAIGPTLLAATLAENMASSEGKTIAAMGSMAGSFSSTMAGNYAYRTSKAALHSAMKALSIDLRPAGVAVVVMHPGRVRTERTPDNPVAVEESVAGMRRVLAGLCLGDSGKFLDYQGKELPW
jgi:NAD(P)-dependent dehydrogenase (short-subunit alcohol dehydrogenase family)